MMARINTNSLEGILAASNPRPKPSTSTSALNKLKTAEAQASIPTTPTVEETDIALASQAGPAPAGTFLGWDYQGNTQTTGTLRRAIIADGKGGSKVSTVTEKNPDYVSGSRGGGGGGGGGGTGGGGGGGGGGNVTTYTASDGKTFTDQQAYVTYETNLRNGKLAADAKLAEEKAARQSAYDLLYQQFKQYGLESLVDGIKDLITSNVSPSEFSIRLQDTPAYQKRFAANQERIKQGLRALTPAEYIGLEDQYQNIMRNYGLPASYYTKDSMGTQAGFNKFIANDVSAAELEDRVTTAQERLLSASPEIMGQLKGYYNISEGDILSYILDPQNALSEIKRKVRAAEIGAGAFQSGLGINSARAEELGAAGVTKQQAQQGFQTVAEVAPRGGQLAAIYGETPYTQQTAEAEVFGLAGSAEAAKQRKKLTQLEQAQFGGQAGTSQGALDRGRQGSF